MSVASRLYQLQGLDLEIAEKRRLLKDTINRLERNQALAAAESEMQALDSRLKVARGRQRQLEYEVDDLSARIGDLNKRLYGGSVHNPKELLSLQQEIDGLKKHLSEKEETLLESMGQLETEEATEAKLRQRLEQVKGEWDKEKEGLSVDRASLEPSLARLIGTRETARTELGDEVLRVYDNLVATKRVAVVPVEQGHCKGCNLTVPTGLWQRARAGEMVQCGSCGRILHVD